MSTMANDDVIDVSGMWARKHPSATGDDGRRPNNITTCHNVSTKACMKQTVQTCSLSPLGRLHVGGLAAMTMKMN